MFVLFFETVLIQASLELLVLLSSWDNKSGPPGLPYPLMFLVVDILRQGFMWSRLALPPKCSGYRHMPLHRAAFLQTPDPCASGSQYWDYKCTPSPPGHFLFRFYFLNILYCSVCIYCCVQVSCRGRRGNWIPES